MLDRIIGGQPFTSYPMQLFPISQKIPNIARMIPFDTIRKMDMPLFPSFFLPLFPIASRVISQPTRDALANHSSFGNSQRHLSLSQGHRL